MHKLLRLSGQRFVGKPPLFEQNLKIYFLYIDDKNNKETRNMD